MFTVTPAPRTRPRPRSLAPLLVVLALASCDALKPAGDDPAPPARPEETPTQPDEQPATAADAKADAASAEELAKTRELLALLNEGRAHVKAKRYAEGVAKYEEALKLDPAHGATMSELGWAAFLSGDLPRAEETLRGALRYVHAPKTRGALLYNLGRVLEDRARPDEAARAYAESLEVRPNDVVQKRLASLEAAVKQAADARAAERTRCAFRAWEGVAPARLCETYVAKLEEEGKVEGGGVECESKDLVEREIAVAAGEEPPTDTLETKIALELDSTTRATTFSYHDHELMMETFVLVVDLGKRWFTYEFAHPSHPGVGMADENVEGLSLKAE
ncbi:MAG: tetratricopeptide repeat protein, partial [Myxococcales bacterium]|nr:tetratricopeptide repeat protein [Myxococcales bacterium]